MIKLYPSVYTSQDTGVQAIQSRTAQRCREVDEKGNRLCELARDALNNGGGISFKSSSSGVYLIHDAKKKTLAVFKPDDEFNHAPCNPKPANRESFPSDIAIRFHKMSTFHQGKAAARSYTSKVLDLEERLPEGCMAKLTSDKFVDITAELKNTARKVQTKIGYLQEWIPNSQTFVDARKKIDKHEHGSYKYEDYQDFSLLDKLPLEEFQIMCILGIVTFNEDLHPGNILAIDSQGDTPHVRPIDFKSILSWQLRDLQRGPYQLNLCKKPFTSGSLEYIKKLDFDFVGDVVNTMELNNQAVKNAQIMTLVLKHFAKEGFTLFDIHKFTSRGEHWTSSLFNMIEEAEGLANSKLTPDDQAKKKHEEYLSSRDFFSKDKEDVNPLNFVEKQWLANYQTKHANRIEQLSLQNFWREFEEKLISYIANLKKSIEAPAVSAALST